MAEHQTAPEWRSTESQQLRPGASVMVRCTSETHPGTALVVGAAILTVSAEASPARPGERVTLTSGDLALKARVVSNRPTYLVLARP